MSDGTIEATEAPGRRVFESGATRDTDAGKPDYEGFLSPLVIEAFGRYMSKNRLMKDGAIRDSDNWQKGIPLTAYAKSGWRHFMEWWKLHRGYDAGCFSSCSYTRPLDWLFFGDAGGLSVQLAKRLDLLPRLSLREEGVSYPQDEARAKPQRGS